MKDYTLKINGHTYNVQIDEVNEASTLARVTVNGTHYEVEIEGGKATGSLEDITRGAFVTITLVDGKATRVVVAQNSGFSGFGGQGGFGGGKGQGGNRRPDGQQTPESTTPTNNT